MQEGTGRHCGVSPHAMPTPNGTSTVTRGFTHEVPFLRGQVTMLDYTGENTRRTWLDKLIQ